MKQSEWEYWQEHLEDTDQIYDKNGEPILGDNDHFLFGPLFKDGKVMMTIRKEVRLQSVSLYKEPTIIFKNINLVYGINDISEVTYIDYEA